MVVEIETHSRLEHSFEFDVCVVGGCGHVGLPLAITFAREGLQVAVVDTDSRAAEMVRAGHMPFMDEGADTALRTVIGNTLHVFADASIVHRARCIVVAIGTPVDEHLNPAFNTVRRLFATLDPHLRDGQCIVLRSTVFPGTTEKVAQIVAASGRDIAVSFCPERVAEGRAMTELRTLPQIVAGCDGHAERMATELFESIALSIIPMKPLEAELTKIFANAWRYIQFATANQFFMIAADYGLDFYRIHDALTRDYPRMADVPTSGFSAGPCLFQDTMQLAAACDKSFWLGHAAMVVNEGIPAFIVRHLKTRHDLAVCRVGILGMAFKAESDDSRESLSYKLRKILEYEAAEVLCSDAFIKDPSFVTAEELIERADIVVIGAPHRAYLELAIPEGTSVVDIWNMKGQGALLG